jgi:hypothetical protein
MTEEAKQTTKSKRPKFILAILVLLVIAAVVALIIKNMSGPAEGSISNTPVNQSAIKPGENNQPKKYDGQYISFNYPSHYATAPSQKSSGYLEIASLINTDHSGKYVSIGVLKESLGNDSGINYRKGHPQIYKVISSTPDKIVFSGAAQGSEQTGFFAHGGLVTTISVTASGTRNLQDDFNAISNSLSWKQ